MIILRYLDWLASILFPDHPGEQELRRIQMIVLFVQILSLIVIAGCVSIILGRAS